MEKFKPLPSMEDPNYFIKKDTSMWMQGEVYHKINSIQSRFFKSLQT